MKKLIFIISFCCIFLNAKSQIATWNFFGQSSPATSPATTTATNATVSSITRGAGAASSTGSNSFRTQGFQNNGIATTNTDYFQTTISATTGNKVSLSSIDAKFVGTTSFVASPGVSSQFAYSLNGTTFTLIGSPSVTIGAPATLTQINLAGIADLQNVASPTVITLRFYASGQTSTGGFGFTSASAAVADNGFSIGGTISPTTAAGTNTITAGAGTEPSTISSLTTTQGAATLNFDVDVQDDGATAATDALDTKITQMIFTQGTGNDVANWTQAIAGAELSDGTNTMAGTIGTNTITFASISPTVLGLIADNATKTYTLKVWLTINAALKATIDGSNLVFRLQSNGITADPTGSQFEATQDQNSGATNNAIAVVATKLLFVQEPGNTNANVAMTPAVTVQATDLYDARDLDFTGSVNITSTGTLTGSPVAATAASGLATFSTLTHTALGTGLILTATSGALTDKPSTTFNIAIVTNAGDYFRSNVATGTWATAASWESSADNIAWMTSTLAPTSAAKDITIRNGHNITISASVAIDQVVVENGGTLTYTTGTLTVNNGAGDDLVIQNGGRYVHAGGTFITFSPTTATFRINTGGMLEATSNTGTPLVYATELNATIKLSMIWDNASIFKWNTTNTPAVQSRTFFPNAAAQSVVPIFRVSASWSPSGAGNVIVDGILDVQADFTWAGAGTKTFKHGIIGTKTMTQSEGAWLITGASSEIGGASGTLTLALGTAGLNVTSATTSVTSSIAATGGKVTMGGAVAQTLAGNGFTIGNLTMNNALGLTLSSPLTVTGELAMTAGKITTTATNLLTFGTAATVTGASATSFVNGPVAKMTNSTSAFTFPTGKGSIYRTIAVTPSVSTPTTYTAEFFDTAPSNRSAVTAPIQAVNSKEYFDLGASPMTQATITMQYDIPAGFCTDISDLSLAHYSGGAWINEAATATGSLTTGTVTTASAVSSYSPFALGSTDAVASPLPISLKSFSAKVSENGNRIEWETAVEENIRTFVVEKSENSKVWAVLSENTPNVSKRYNTQDLTPFKSTTYYRLRIVENDGHEEFSAIINVKSSRNGLDANVISAQNEQFRLKVQSADNQDATVSIVDMNGRLVANYQIDLSKGENDFTLNTSLQNGMYVVKITTSNGEQVSKLMRY